MKRLDAIDYARGVFAASIMGYHVARYSGGHMHPALATVGIYGVEAFFVISGISFGYTSGGIALSADSLRAFAIKRFARLAPLYWLAMALTMFVGWGLYRPVSIAANASLLFGLASPAMAIPKGGWSIGCEVAFYLAFPFIALAFRSGFWPRCAAVAVSLAPAVWITARLDTTTTLQQQWGAYVSPLNHAVFFVAGVGVASLVGRVVLPTSRAVAVLVAAFAVFALLSVDADQIAIVTGWRRVALSAACVAGCAALALGELSVRGRAGDTMEWLGAVSYSVYMLHPIAYRAIEHVHAGVAPWACAPITLIAARLAYRHIEAPATALGKRLAHRGERNHAYLAAIHD